MQYKNLHFYDKYFQIETEDKLIAFPYSRISNAEMDKEAFRLWFQLKNGGDYFRVYASQEDALEDLEPLMQGGKK